MVDLIFLFLLHSHLISGIVLQDQDQDLRLIDNLIQELGNDSSRTRDNAELELIRIGIKASIRIETIAKQTSDPEIKSRCRRILEVLDLVAVLGTYIGREFASKRTAIDRLRILIRHQWSIRRLSLSAEGISKITDAVTGMQPDKHERIDVLTELAAYRLEFGSLLLRSWAEDSDGEVRQAAVESIIILGDKTHIPILRKLISDQEPGIRLFSVLALKRLDPISSKEQVLHLRDDSIEYVSKAAKWFLGELEDSEYFALLSRYLDASDDTYCRYTGLRLLAVFRAKGFNQKIARCLDDKIEKIRGEACLALADLESREFVAKILDQFKSKDGLVRLNAAKSLIQLSPNGVDQFLSAHLKDESCPLVREAITLAIKQIQEKR